MMMLEQDTNLSECFPEDGNDFSYNATKIPIINPIYRMGTVCTFHENFIKIKPPIDFGFYNIFHKIDASSVHPSLESITESVDIKVFDQEEDMEDLNIYLPLPPIKEISVEIEILSIEKGKPHFVHLDYF